MATRKGKLISFAMSDNDVKALLAHVPAEPWEYEAKRLFVLMLLTGASLIEARRFTRDNISKDGRLFSYTSVYGKDITMRKPELLDVYIDKSFDYRRNNNTMSTAIKSVFRYAEIHSPVIDDEGDRHRMCDVITMSIARYTFATRMYHKGASLQEIMDTMGTTSRVFITRAIQGYSKKKYKPRRK